MRELPASIFEELANVQSSGWADGHVPTRSGNGFVPGSGASVAGRWEVIVDGVSPPVAVTNMAEDDWLYGWVED